MPFFKKITLLSALFLYFNSPVYAQLPAGTVISLTGKAWTQSEEKRQILHIKSQIMEKDTLITDKDGRMLILFTDDSVLSLGPSTTVSIHNFSFDKTKSPNMAIHIAKGLTRIVSGKIVQQRPQNFKISSPLATIGIRGTITMHKVTKEGELHFVESLGEGHDVWIQGQDGKIVTLKNPLLKVDLVPSGSTPTTGQLMPQKEQKKLQEFFIPETETNISPSFATEANIQIQHNMLEEENALATQPRQKPKE